MKKFVLASLVLSIVAGCGQIQPTAYSTRSLDDATVVRDMGFKGGKTLALNLSVPQEALRGIQAVSDFKGWTAKDIYQYDLTLSDVTTSTAKTLATFSVVCKEGKAKALFTNLKPGLKYQIKVVAKGNKGGTAATSVLNTQTPAVGNLDLTETAPDSGAIEVTTSIVVQLDGAYERTGSVSLVPLDGNTISDAAEVGFGECGDCEDNRITGGTTTYDSTLVDGDVFSTDASTNSWTNKNNGWAWIQHDLDGVYEISKIRVRHAYSDLRYAPCTDIYLKVRNLDGEWVTVDHLQNTNLNFYTKTLTTPIKATAFRLVMTDLNGWFSATGLSLHGVAGSQADNEQAEKVKKEHDDNGHGNDEGHFDPSNPGKNW